LIGAVNDSHVVKGASIE